MAVYAAFDPGETTGFAVGVVDTPKTGQEWKLVASGAFGWRERFHAIQEILGQYKPEIVIVESFRLYAHKAESQIGNEFPSVRIIGAIEALMWTHGELSVFKDIVFQPASVRTRVKKIHDNVAPGPHARDAYQHLRYYLVTNRIAEVKP